MNRFYKRNFPPGYNYITELGAISAILTAGALISLFRFFHAYAIEKQGLYNRRGTDLILDESRVMPDFVHLLGDRLHMLLILAGLVFVIVSAIHYAYYFNGSKSIYLMGRLPGRLTLYRQCLLAPLIFALIFILLAAVLLLIYYAVYMSFTPRICLTPNQWQKLWRIFR